MSEKGVAYLFPLVVIVLLVVGFFLVVQKGIKLPFGEKKPVVALKTEYENPFDKNTQYVNPFETYKNPFVVSR